MGIIVLIFLAIFVLSFTIVFVYALIDSNADEIKDFLCSLIGVKTKITEQYVKFTSYPNFDSYHSEPGSVSISRNYSGGYSGTYSKGLSWSSTRESYGFETPSGTISISVRDDSPRVSIWYDDFRKNTESFATFNAYGILKTKSRWVESLNTAFHLMIKQVKLLSRTMEKLKVSKKPNAGRMSIFR